MENFSNVNDCLDKWFKVKRNDIAIIVDNGDDLDQTTYGALSVLVERYRNYFHSQGLNQGDLVLTNLIPSVEYAAVHFALFRLGCIPVIIDTGVSKTQKVACIKDSAPDFLISDTEGIRLSELYPEEFSSIGKKINISELHFNQIAKNPALPNVSIKLEDTLCLFFTSGSTGTPKATIWSQRNVVSQITLQNENLDRLHFHTDLIVFPFFLLTSLLKGMTCVLSEVNFGNPIASNPLNIINTINKLSVSSGFASPTFWNKIMDYCISKDINLESLKMITTAGSPSNPKLIEKMTQVMTSAEIATPYGATEAILPITSINASALLSERIMTKTLSGKGVCLGKPVETAIVKVIRPLADKADNSWSKVEVLQPYQIGEIIVSGPMVTNGYYKNENATRNSKLIEISLTKNLKRLYHRMGDLGYFDDTGNLWFCGRKKDAFTSKNYTFYTANTETLFNSISGVKKCAIVKLEKADLVFLIIEPNDNELSSMQEKVFEQIGKSSIPIDKVLLYKRPLPVDNRHNTKIERHMLRKELENGNYANFDELERVTTLYT